MKFVTDDYHLINIHTGIRWVSVDEYITYATNSNNTVNYRLVIAYKNNTSTFNYPSLDKAKVMFDKIRSALDNKE